MRYTFHYFKGKGDEKQVVITAQNDREAALKFFDLHAESEFGCIREDGEFFTDENFPKEREIILRGC